MLFRSRNEQEERKKDGRQFSREGDFPGNAPESESDEFRKPGRKKNPGDRSGTDDDEESIQDVGSEEVLGIFSFLLLAGEDGHERRRQRILCKEVAQEVGNAEGGVKGVCRCARAVEIGKNGFADKAHYAADGRADRKRPDALRNVGHDSCLSNQGL